MFKKILATLLFSAAAAHADYRFIVPQEPGAGTSIWATVIGRELEKKLGEKIVIEHIPGARDIPGANKFQSSLRFDHKTVMVAHGGNAEAFLLEQVNYSYSDWTPIGLQNLSVVVGYKAGTDLAKGIRFAAGSGNNPDAMAMTLLVCGPMPSLTAYLDCYKNNFKFVNGMKANERRLAYVRGELNAQRETPTAWNKFYAHSPDSVTWFSHGILDIKTGKTVSDTNYPGRGSFQEVYQARWGAAPAGDLYDAYLLVKSYRDVLQKSLWVNKGNPNAAKLTQALQEMLSDPVSMKVIEEQTGQYPWLVGKDAYRATTALAKLTTRKALKDLVWWSTTAFGVAVVYKDDIAIK